jgi:hypothetical protein
VRVAEFGPFVVDTDVDVAVVDTLRLWLPTYLAQAERERGLANKLLARPVEESYANVLEDDEFADHRLPAILVTTANLADTDVGSDGLYSGRFQVNVTAVVRGRTPAEARAVAALFAGCIRRVMLDHPSLGHFAGTTRLVGGTTAPVRDVTNAGRYLAGGISVFSVFVDELLQVGAGPQIPADPYDDPDPSDPDTPYDPLVTVTAVTVDVPGVPITDEPGS